MNEEKINFKKIESKKTFLWKRSVSKKTAMMSLTQIFILIVATFAFAYIIWQTDNKIGRVNGEGETTPIPMSWEGKTGTSLITDINNQVKYDPQFLTKNPSALAQMDLEIEKSPSIINGNSNFEARDKWFAAHRIDESGGITLDRYNKDSGELTYLTNGNSRVQTTINTKDLEKYRIRGKIDGEGYFNFKDIAGNEGPKMIGGKIVLKQTADGSNTLFSIDNGRVDYSWVKEGNFQVEAGEGSQIMAKNKELVQVGKGGITSSYNGITGENSFETGNGGTSYLVKDKVNYEFNGKIGLSNVGTEIKPNTEFSMTKSGIPIAKIITNSENVFMPGSQLSNDGILDSTMPAIRFDAENNNVLIGGSGDFGKIILNDPHTALIGAIDGELSDLRIFDSFGNELAGSDRWINPEFRGNVDLVSGNLRIMTDNIGSQLVGDGKNLLYHRFAYEPTPDVAGELTDEVFDDFILKESKAYPYGAGSNGQEPVVVNLPDSTSSEVSSSTVKEITAEPRSRNMAWVPGIDYSKEYYDSSKWYSRVPDNPSPPIEQPSPPTDGPVTVPQTSEPLAPGDTTATGNTVPKVPEKSFMERNPVIKWGLIGGGIIAGVSAAYLGIAALSGKSKENCPIVKAMNKKDKKK